MKTRSDSSGAFAEVTEVHPVTLRVAAINMSSSQRGVVTVGTSGSSGLCG
ncbi:hypothetical protein AS9A_2719 [Hoyosella subflava DQS3-9A1]|uniref:Uncharacterized protein n=1 Tax=Hoyosella subflava (strain DSM 45089 / JCM 17490 / NBRC 109087 / DQS3-9A1) TaxID=443218 RepID=F6EI59_HOYSD|nr:hypothetical protein AS9A_2719 [Hoyosella subflava DQS3-9A1]